MPIKGILFDFDGVLVESLDIKTEAFKELFAKESDHLPAIVEFHLANGGLSRFTKFELIFREILHRPLSNVMKDELGRRFSDLVMSKVVVCPYVSGALEFIQKYSRLLPLFIASATPQAELQDILARRGMAGYFRETHGSPLSKSTIAQSILSRYQLKTDELLFIGDAINDYQTAREVGLPFIGRVFPDQVNPFPVGVSVISDLTHLTALIRETKVT